MNRSEVAIALATICAWSMPCVAMAQEYVSSGGRTAFDVSTDRFSASLDSLGDTMAHSYSQRQLATAQTHKLAAEADAGHALSTHLAHIRALESMIAGRNPMDQGPYNQGNNQGNNGFLPGTLIGSGIGAFPGLYNAGLFPGQFGSLPFPGTFGTLDRSPFAFRNAAGNSTSTFSFSRNGSSGFNGTATGTRSGTASDITSGNPATNTRTSTTTISGRTTPTF